MQISIQGVNRIIRKQLPPFSSPAVLKTWMVGCSILQASLVYMVGKNGFSSKIAAQVLHAAN